MRSWVRYNYRNPVVYMNLHQDEQRNTVQVLLAGVGFLHTAKIPFILRTKMFQWLGPDLTIVRMLVIEENYTHSDKIGQGTLHLESSLLCLVRRVGIHIPKILGRRRAEWENPGLSLKGEWWIMGAAFTILSYFDDEVWIFSIIKHFLKSSDVVDVGGGVKELF